ncbi:hypothetical protein ALC60_14272, partial [Trachymyrmex zeteki]
NLGVPTKFLPDSHNGWICIVSRGNCIYPSRNFVKATEVMNEEFLKFHGNLFSKEDKIFEKLTNIVMQKTNHKFPKEVLGDFSEEQGERFHQDIKEMERRYQGRWDINMMAEFCWTLKREIQAKKKQAQKESITQVI